MLELLLRLNDSIIGYASVPEILFMALALWAGALAIVDWRRGRDDWRSILMAIEKQIVAAESVQARILAVRQRMSSDTVRVRKHAFFTLIALLLMTVVPDYVREPLRIVFWIVTVGFCLTEIDQIADLRSITRTWGKVNAIVGERDHTDALTGRHKEDAGGTYPDSIAH